MSGLLKSDNNFHLNTAKSLISSRGNSDSRASNIAVIILYLLGKFAITATFVVLCLYTPEQFPTNLRNASLGVSSMAARAGGIIGSYSRTLSRHVPWAPSTIYGVCCLLLPICMRMLPETRGRDLPITIEEMELSITKPHHVSPRKQVVV